ncbi:hypothetical protein IWQ62_003158, partial [Dispira parvispora]
MRTILSELGLETHFFRNVWPERLHVKPSTTQTEFFQSDFQTTAPCYRSPTRTSTSRWRQGVKRTPEAVEPRRDPPPVWEGSPSVPLNEWQPASVHRFTVPNGSTTSTVNETGGGGSLHHAIPDTAGEVEDVEDKFEEEITRRSGDDDWSELWAQQTRKAELYSMEDELEWDHTEAPVQPMPNFVDEDIEPLDDTSPNEGELSLGSSGVTGMNADTARNMLPQLKSSTVNPGGVRTFRDIGLSSTESLHYEFRLPKVGRVDHSSECLVSLSNALVCHTPCVSTEPTLNTSVGHSRYTPALPGSSSINQNPPAASRPPITDTSFPPQQPVSWTLPSIDTSPPRPLGHPPPRPKKYRVKPGGYLERLHQLVRQERSNHILWHHLTHSKFSHSSAISPQVSAASSIQTTAENCLRVRLSCVIQRGALLEAVCDWVDPALPPNASPELHALTHYYGGEMKQGQPLPQAVQRQVDHCPLSILFIRDYLSSFEQSRAYDSLQQTVAQRQVLCLYKPWFVVPLTPTTRESETTL